MLPALLLLLLNIAARLASLLMESSRDITATITISLLLFSSLLKKTKRHGGLSLCPNCQERLGGFAAAHGVNAGALKNVARGLIVFFRGAAKHNLASARLADDCRALG